MIKQSFLSFGFCVFFLGGGVRALGLKLSFRELREGASKRAFSLKVIGPEIGLRLGSRVQGSGFRVYRVLGSLPCPR